MRKYFFAFATIAFAAIACNKEVDNVQPEQKEMRHITVLTETPGTRTVLDDEHNALLWASGDNFRLMTNTAEEGHDAQTLTYSEGGLFEAEVSVDATEAYAYYYAGTYTDANHSTPTAYTAYIEYDQSQTKAGVLNGQLLPMAARGTINDDNTVSLEFHQMAGVLALNIYSTAKVEGEVINSVKVTPVTNTKFCGAQYATDLTADNVSYTEGSDKYTTVTVNLGEAYDYVSSKPVDKRLFDSQIYVVLAKQSYSSVKFEVITNKGKYEITSSGAPLDLSTNDFYPVNINLAKATYEAVDPDAKGSLNNPYTVAEAKAAIDAGEGIDGVYVKGIISKIVTGYSSQYGNISFNISADGSEEGDQIQAFRAKATSGANFVVGNGVLMNGDLLKYNGTYELNANCTLVDFITKPTFTPASGTEFETSVDVSIAAAEGATIYYTLDETVPTTESTEFTDAISLTETTTVKAIAAKGVIYSAPATAIYSLKDPSIDVNDFTWDLTKASYSSASADQVKWENANATMVADKAGASTNANNYLPTTQSSTRFYKSSKLTFTPATGVTISKVEYTATTANYASVLANSTWTNASASVSNTVVTIIPENKSNAFSAVIGGTTGASAVKVFYTGGSDIIETEYSITVNSAENGTVTASAEKAIKGTDIILTVTPDDGYELATLTVKKEDGDDVDVTNNKFTMPESNVTVSATFKIASSSNSVVYDFTGNDWSVSDGILTDGTVSFTGEGAANFKMHSDGYFFMGKSGAYINFPSYSYPVTKIVVTGKSGASGSVKQNIYVGETAVSTETTGATGTNTYNIASDYQSAGTVYTLKVTSAHNTQITKIEVFFN